VDVDEARGHEMPLGVDLAPAAAVNLPHMGDDTVRHGDVADEPLVAGAVHDGAVADDQVVF
jgi:hypothetical protein